VPHSGCSRAPHAAFIHLCTAPRHMHFSHAFPHRSRISPRCCHCTHPHAAVTHPRTVSYIPTLLSCILCCSYALPSFLHCHCLCHHCRCCCRVVIVRQMDESRHRKNSNEQEHLLPGKHMDGQFTTQNEFKKTRAFTNWRAQKDGKVRPHGESKRAKGTHRLERRCCCSTLCSVLTCPS
jgi:hypothetical protein